MAPQEIHLGQVYYDHYEQYLRAPIDRRQFADANRQLQVLAYGGVFAEAMMFASLGMSLWSDCVGGVGEVVCVVDDALESVPRLLANALFFFAQKHTNVRRGALADGLGNIDPKFALAFGKSAFYITSCQGLPEAFSSVESAGRSVGQVHMGMFISASEAQYLREHGVDKFEDALQAASVDPFNLRRVSIV